MDWPTLLILLSFPGLLIAAAFFSSVETALFSLSYQDRQRLRRTHPAQARVVAYLLARPRELLVTLLLMNMTATTIYFVLTSFVLLRADHPLMGIAVEVINLLLMTVLAEVVSKVIAARHRVAVSRLTARWTLALFRALGPLRVILDRGVVTPLLRLAVPPEREHAAHAHGQSSGGSAGGTPTPHGASLTREELTGLLSLGKQQGAIDGDESRVLRQVIRLGTLRVREVMTHRVDMEWIDQAATLEQVRDSVRRTRLTHVPVCIGTLEDEIVGLLDTKKYLALAALGQRPTLRSCMDAVLYVPERVTLDKLLEVFRARAAKVGIVVSEYGAVVGVVATQDVVSRLVAELSAEEGSAEAEARVEMVAPERWVMSGRVSARDWSEMFGLHTDGRVSTMAGLVMARLGRVPHVGDTVTLGNVVLEVEAVEGRVAERIGVRLVDSAPDHPAGPPPGAHP